MAVKIDTPQLILREASKQTDNTTWETMPQPTPPIAQQTTYTKMSRRGTEMLHKIIMKKKHILSIMIIAF